MMFSAAATLALRPAARMVPATARVSRATFATMSGNPTAKCTTSMGEFKVELFEDKLPITVGNFVDLAKTGYYEGLTFHRVIPNFMNQFGCPLSKDPTSPRAGTGGPEGGTSFTTSDGKTITRNGGGNIPDELTAEISNEIGTLSMANTGAPDSGGSQFFINTKHNAFLDWFDTSTPSKHPVFGKVTEGMDVVNAINTVPTGPGDKPKTPVVMEKIEIM